MKNVSSAQDPIISVHKNKFQLFAAHDFPEHSKICCCYEFLRTNEFVVMRHR